MIIKKAKLNWVSIYLPVFTLCMLLVNQWAYAELVIEITQGMDDAQPIAVVPFAWKGKGRIPTDIAGVVDADLHRSGQFKPISRDKMLSRPSEREQVFFRDWRVLGV